MERGGLLLFGKELGQACQIASLTPYGQTVVEMIEYVIALASGRRGATHLLICSPFTGWTAGYAQLVGIDYCVSAGAARLLFGGEW